jgi:hypothetical protein
MHTPITVPAATGLPNTVPPVVESLLRIHSDRPIDERRSEIRHPYSKLIELLPIDKRTLRSIGDPITVVGKELSVGGIGFYHHEVIPYRYLLVPVSQGKIDAWLLTRIRWCRFLKPGWYESGGQFVRKITELPEIIG